MIEIVQLVNLSEVDPIYFETSYFSVPEKPGRRAYALLLRTMQQLKLAALAKVTLHQRERIVLIRPYENGLTLHTIYYPNEIHRVAEYGRDRVEGLKQREITLSEQFAKGLVKPFRPEVFRDTYQDRVQQLIDSKAKGISAPKPERPKKLAPVHRPHGCVEEEYCAREALRSCQFETLEERARSCPGKLKIKIRLRRH